MTLREGYDYTYSFVYGIYTGRSRETAATMVVVRRRVLRNYYRHLLRITPTSANGF